MATFTIVVRYGSGAEVTHGGLDEQMALTGIGAFFRDMAALAGAGVKSISVEVES